MKKSPYEYLVKKKSICIGQKIKKVPADTFLVYQKKVLSFYRKQN